MSVCLEYLKLILHNYIYKFSNKTGGKTAENTTVNKSEVLYLFSRYHSVEAAMGVTKTQHAQSYETSP